MRQNIYQRAIDCFHENHGYMSFGQLKDAGVTIGQIHELEAMDVLQKIARGWYWCRECGWEKPKDYKKEQTEKSVCFLFEKVLKRRRIL